MLSYDNIIQICQLQDQRVQLLSIIEQQDAIFALLGVTVALLKAAHDSLLQSEHEPQAATPAPEDINPRTSHIKGTLNPLQHLSEDIYVMSQLANANIFSETISGTQGDPEYIHVPEDTNLEQLYTPLHLQ